MPQWVIWVILVIVAIAIIWFFWNRSQESKAAAERAEAEQRRATSAAAARTAVTAPRAAVPPAEPRAERVEARLQDAANSAMGTDLPQETARIEAAAEDLVKARQEAEAVADRLSAQADAALAEVQQAGQQVTNPDEPIDVETVLIEEGRRIGSEPAQEAFASGSGEVPPGAVRGDGGRDCPPVYPIKANAHSMLYHTTVSHSYGQTIPALCFTTTSAAEAAGFSPARD